jgi:hypothetical protein
LPGAAEEREGCERNSILLTCGVVIEGEGDERTVCKEWAHSKPRRRFRGEKQQREKRGMEGREAKEVKSGKWKVDRGGVAKEE